jgi:hypothetical protein
MILVSKVFAEANLRRTLLILMLFATIVVAPANAQQPCEGLAGLKLPNVTITIAQSITTGKFTPPSPSIGDPIPPLAVPAFCRVAGEIKPSSDSDIKFEVWMPAAGWNGRFVQLGNGGFAGLIGYRAMAPKVQQGFATASTDDGHTAIATNGNFPYPTWAINHPEKVADFGYRAVEETARASKGIIQAYYGQPSHRSYFLGCSDGGREALMEAQRFPDEFDGIIAGAPANFWTHLFAGFVWDEQAVLNDPASYIPQSKLALLQSQLLAACDALDRVKDGLVEDPRRCHFDLKKLECKDADGPGCLTAPQIEAVRKIYAGPKNPRTGEQISPGFAPGAEATAGWPGWIIAEDPAAALQFMYGNGFFGDMLFQDPKWNFRTLNFDGDITLADSKLGPILNSTNPNLTAFKAHGGKLIQYHGWADPAVPPISSINYYENVVATMGGKTARKGSALQETQSFYRLFMAPGMGHCNGGPGPNSFGKVVGGPGIPGSPRDDIVSALEEWVERGSPPVRIVATKYVDDNPSKGVKMTRPSAHIRKRQNGREGAVRAMLPISSAGLTDQLNCRTRSPPARCPPRRAKGPVKEILRHSD